jgi:uncharacterized protein
MLDGEPRTSGGLIRCALHGLHFDPSRASGCVVCRRSSLPPAAAKDGLGAKLSVGVAAGAAVLCVAGGSLALWSHHHAAASRKAAQVSAVTGGAPGGAPGQMARTPGAFGPPPGYRSPGFDPRRRYQPGALSRQDASEALARIATARASCAADSEAGCIRYASECGPFEFQPGMAGVQVLPPFELQDELRDACRGASLAVRKLCEGGSLTACDAALSSGMFVNEGRPTLQHACDLGSVRGCRGLLNLLPAESVEREAALMRTEELEKCGTAPPGALCAVLSRQQLTSAATDRLKQQALQRCRTGTVEDCNHYAAIYARKETLDATLSAQLTQEACKRGDPGSCSRLSVILAEGRGLPRDQQRALELRDQGTAEAVAAIKDCKGDAYGCAMLQLAYTKAGGDPAEQFRRAELAPDEVAKECAVGKLSACQALRNAYSGGASRLPPDPNKVAQYGAKTNQLLEQKCGTGDRDACMTLARDLLYLPPQDIARGRQLADQACARGGYLDCWMLGEFLERGPAGHDPATASAYYARAVTAAKPLCNSGDAGACQTVAQAYYQGRGVPRDERKYGEYTLKILELSKQSK